MLAYLQCTMPTFMIQLSAVSSIRLFDDGRFKSTESPVRIGKNNSPMKSSPSISRKKFSPAAKGRKANGHRRSSEEIRSLILQSAIDLFSERGYSGTTTRMLAERAEVEEVLIFRHFGTKAALFEQAIVKPFMEMSKQYLQMQRTGEQNIATVSERSERYIELIYDLLVQDRKVFRALIISTHTDDPELRSLFHRDESPLIKYLEEVTKGAKASFGKAGIKADPSVAARITFGMAFMLAVFGDVMFPKRKIPKREAVIKELAAYSSLRLKGST